MSHPRGEKRQATGKSSDQRDKLNQHFNAMNEEIKRWKMKK